MDNQVSQPAQIPTVPPPPQQNLVPSQPMQPNSPSPLKNRKMIISVGVIFLLLILGGGTYVLNQNQTKKHTSSLNEPTPLPTSIASVNPSPTIKPQVTITTTLTPTSPDFKTYTNAKYSYSVDVPKDMKIIEENQTANTATDYTNIQSFTYEIDDSVCKGGCSYPIKTGWLLNIRVQKNWTSGYNKDFFKQSPPLKSPGVLFEEEKTINGITMLITERTRADMPDVGNIDWYADFVDKGNWYRITFSTDTSQKKSSKDTFYNLLTTFKFTN